MPGYGTLKNDSSRALVVTEKGYSELCMAQMKVY